MTDVTPDLFRKKMTWRMMQTVEAKLDEFQTAAIHDNVGAVTAGMYDLAAKAAMHAGRRDIAELFEKERDATIERIKSTPPMRKRRRKRNPNTGEFDE